MIKRIDDMDEYTRQLKKYIDEVCLDKGALLTGYTRIRKLTNTLVIAYPYPEEIFTKSFSYKVKRLREEYIKNKEIHKSLSNTLRNEGYFLKEKTVLSVYGDLRPIARSANLGDWGVNGLIVNEKYGSNMLFSTIFTDAPIIDEKDLVHQINNNNKIKRCKNCGKCMNNCPGKAFESGIFNVKKCLPYALRGCNQCMKSCSLQ